MATAGTLEKHCSQKTICSGVRLKCGGNFKKGYLITLIYFMAENECQWTAEFSIFPVWHTEWAFQRQTWEENVCSCTAQQRSQGALFHQNTGCSDCGWTMKKKKWLRWQTKIDLALLCALSSPHPSLFSIFRAPPGWRKSRKATAERGRRDEKGRGGEGRKRGVKEGQQGPGNSCSLGRNRRALKSNLQATGWWRGWGWVREQCGRHWDNQ